MGLIFRGGNGAAINILSLRDMGLGEKAFPREAWERENSLLADMVLGAPVCIPTRSMGTREECHVCIPIQSVGTRGKKHEPRLILDS